MGLEGSPESGDISTQVMPISTFGVIDMEVDRSGRTCVQGEVQCVVLQRSKGNKSKASMQNEFPAW